MESQNQRSDYTTSIIYKLNNPCYDCIVRKSGLSVHGKEEKVMFTIVLKSYHREYKRSALNLNKEQGFDFVRSYKMDIDDCFDRICKVKSIG